MVFRRPNGEIAWSCDACGDEGVITGWEGSPADVSGLDDDDVEGVRVTLLIARELFDDASELLVARARGSAAGVILTGRPGAFEEPVEYVAAEADAEVDGPRMRLLDEACSALDASLPAG
jgi:PAS domain-containing protein